MSMQILRKMHDPMNLPQDVLKKRNKLISKIVPEHFAMTLCSTDIKMRNINYLWWLYHKGTGRAVIKPFMLIFELNLLVSLGLLSKDELSNIKAMLDSVDSDNYYMALLIIEKKREDRIKLHGKWREASFEHVSDELKDLVNNYLDKVVNEYPISSGYWEIINV